MGFVHCRNLSVCISGRVKSQRIEAGVYSHDISDGEDRVDKVELCALEVEICLHARNISCG